MPDTLSPETRLHRVRERILRACARSGREPSSVTLAAVSKLHPPEAVRALAALGQVLFAESYIQEALPKMDALADLAVEWHFVGRLQKNKVKFVPGRFGLIHTVDSLELARVLHEKNAEKGSPQAVLIQANLAGETQKAGCPEERLMPLAEAILGMPGLALRGLMILPPWEEDPERSRPWFARLRDVRDRLAAALGTVLPVLSMGMSHDLEQAVEEGATLVRVGTDLFGERAALR